MRRTALADSGRYGPVKSRAGEGRVIPVLETLAKLLASELAHRHPRARAWPTRSGRFWTTAHWRRDVWRPAVLCGSVGLGRPARQLPGRARDKDLDVARERIVSALRAEPALAESLDLEVSAGEVARWRSAGRLARLVRRWPTDHPDYAELEAWRLRDKHLWCYDAHESDQLAARRRDLYCQLAAWVARSAGELSSRTSTWPASPARTTTRRQPTRQPAIRCAWSLRASSWPPSLGQPSGRARRTGSCRRAATRRWTAYGARGAVAERSTSSGTSRPSA